MPPRGRSRGEFSPPTGLCCTWPEVGETGNLKQRRRGRRPRRPALDAVGSQKSGGSKPPPYKPPKTMPKRRPVRTIFPSTCHSEPRSGEESREQDTEATEYGILHYVQDDRIFFGRRPVLDAVGSRNTVSRGRGFLPGRYTRRWPCLRPAAPYRRNWFRTLPGYTRDAPSAPRKRCR